MSVNKIYFRHSSPAMNQEDGNDEDQSPDHWFSNFEDECLDELETQGRIDARLQSAEEHAAQQLYSGFQSTSTAIAQLYNYKVASQDDYPVLMIPFNKAAESLTKFYKDSLINARECLRLGVQSGRNSRARDIAAWAKKKRKCIRREELLAYLCGRNMPAHPHHRSRQNRSLERQLPRRSHQNETFESGEYPVRDALTLQGLNGAMSNINMSYSRPGSTTSSSTSMARAPVMEEILFHHHHHSDDLSGWSCNTDHHHGSRKRHGSSSATDVNMESPSRKRGKYL